MASQIIIIAFTCLLLSGIIGLFDGLYLHLWKYKLYLHKQSRFEHIIHAIRCMAVIFITYFLFVKDYGGWMLWIGVFFVLIDVIALSVDIFSENDSRSHLGGLSSIEYYIHVTANGLHFASTALILAAKPLEAWSFHSTVHLDRFANLMVHELAINLLPGTLILGILHFALMNKKIAKAWLKFQRKLSGKLEFVTA